tara:strand:- start:354 stop:665 length:312 start_codon:yes stop_codon:yes gene_type:complete
MLLLVILAWPDQEEEFANRLLQTEMLASMDVYNKLNILFQLFQERELSEILQSVELDQKDGNQLLDQTLSHKLEEVIMFTFLLPTLNNQDSTNNNLLKCNLCK